MLDPFRFAQRGVTLIELMIAIIIVSILLAIALPNFNAWVQNAQIRTATESIQNGLQLARAEAVRRNEAVNFILGSGSGWTVSTVAVPGTPIQSRVSSEGSVNVTVTVTPAGATTATFNTLGRLANPAAAPTQIDLDVPVSILPANQSKELRINITSGGQIRSCDPNVTASDDPRKC
ncbi:MAG: GspH/FimT family pseudopilin [Gallionellaceae bacterium]|nr:GspH/FimT family pseudopilin [Gallionellaceae bacterium]